MSIFCPLYQVMEREWRLPLELLEHGAVEVGCRHLVRIVAELKVSNRWICCFGLDAIKVWCLIHRDTDGRSNMYLARRQSSADPSYHVTVSSNSLQMKMELFNY